MDIERLTQGTDLTAVVTVQNQGLMDYRDLALEQVFPSGWEIQNNRIAGAESTESPAGLTYQDIRDDRVYTYFNLLRGERKTFVVRLNAAYAGRFYLPGIYCEAMYDNGISAMKKGKWIEIVRNGD